MEIKILGFKARIEVIAVSMIIGFLLCSHSMGAGLQSDFSDSSDS